MSLIKELDRIASVLEGRGLIKEASDIDLITNTLEKQAYNVEVDGKVKAMRNAISSLEKGNPKNAVTLLNGTKELWKNFVQWYGSSIPEVASAHKAYTSALDMLSKSGDLLDQAAPVISYLTNSIELLKKGSQEISRAQLRPTSQDKSNLVYK